MVYKGCWAGGADAQFLLGTMFDGGAGVPEDKNTAVSWYTKAAEQGDADAQYNLSLMYKSGEGINEDKENTNYWYSKTAEEGNDSAISNSNIILGKLSPSLVYEWQQLIKDLYDKTNNKIKEKF